MDQFRTGLMKGGATALGRALPFPGSLMMVAFFGMVVWRQMAVTIPSFFCFDIAMVAAVRDHA